MKSSQIEFEVDSSIDFTGVETELRSLWKQYQTCLLNPETEDLAEELRQEYYSLYRNYRTWREIP